MTYNENEPPVIGKMIWVDKEQYIHLDKIGGVSRCGNYTHITVKEGYVYQIWDENKTLWYAIMKLSDKV